MAIVINDYKPADAATVEIEFPGGGKRYRVPDSSTLTVGQLRRISKGDLEALFGIFPDDALEEIDKLHLNQFNELIESYLGNPKGPQPSRG